MATRFTPPSGMFLWSAAATVTVIAAALTLNAKSTITTKNQKSIPSPRTTLLPCLTPAQIASLGYPPDALPGARDVETPYGFMRMYEWGPIEGRKVVMVHGDATPAPIFSRIAGVLVDAGYRVICLDLWGRGYSDTPCGVAHDTKLYAQQLHYAISASASTRKDNDIKLEEGSQQCIALVGFSMGASIVLEYFTTHPSTIENIVLLAPGGLIRQLPDEYTSIWFRFPYLAGKSRIRRLIGTLLGVDIDQINEPMLLTDEQSPSSSTSNLNETIREPSQGFTPSAALQFQYIHHKGHIESFLSTIQSNPFQNQHSTWRRAGEMIMSSSSSSPPKIPMYHKKTLVICGADDTVIIPSEIEKNLERYFVDHNNNERKKYFELRFVSGGHGFPWDEGDRVGKLILEGWGVDSGFVKIE